MYIRHQPDESDSEGEHAEYYPSDETEPQVEKVEFVAFHHCAAAVYRLIGRKFGVFLEYVWGHRIGEGLDDLKDLFCDAGSSDFLTSYKNKSLNCIHLWNEKYKDYAEKVTGGGYIRMMKKIAEK